MAQSFSNTTDTAFPKDRGLLWKEIKDYVTTGWKNPWRGTSEQPSGVDTYNSKFMKDNPQYGYNGQSNPTKVDFSAAQNKAIKNQPLINSVKKPVVDTTTQTNTAPVTTPPVTTPPKTDTAIGSVFKGLTGIGTSTTGAGSTTGTYQDWLMKQAQGTTPAATAITGLQDIAQNESPEVKQARENAKQAQLMQNDVRNNPNVAAEVSVGRGQALTGLVNAQQQAYQNALGSQGQQIQAGQSAGQLGLTGQAQQLGAGEAAAGLGLTQQGQQISALQNAGSLAMPQGYSPTTSPYNPVEGTFGGGGTTQMDRAIYGSNIEAAIELNREIQKIQSDQPAISANFDYLNNVAQGFSTNIPILTQIQSRIADTAKASQIIAQYKQAIEAINLQGKEYGISVKENATPADIQGAQQALNVAIQNKLVGKQNKLQQLRTGGTSGQSSGSGIYNF